VNEGHLDPLNLRLVCEGLARFETLEEELGFSFHWRRVGYLCLINSLSLWNEWAARAEVLTSAGIPTEMLGLDELRSAEPHLNTSSFLGAAYSLEGLLDPFRFCWAYASAARRHGADLRAHTPVTAMSVEGSRVMEVQADGEWHTADQVAIMCGAWTARVASLAGAEVPIRHTHAEAFVTEPVRLQLHNTIGMADFYETIHGKSRAVSVGFGRELNGSLVVTEAVAQTSQLHKGHSDWGLAAMAADLLRLYPELARTRALRVWGIPTPYTPDDEPIIGWLPERDNLFLAAGFLLTITALPLLSEWMARMILGESLPVDLRLFSPSRFGAREGAG
jgi:sarcosine oxidase subunit beta